MCIYFFSGSFEHVFVCTCLFLNSKFNSGWMTLLWSNSGNCVFGFGAIVTFSVQLALTYWHCVCVILILWTHHRNIVLKIKALFQLLSGINRTNNTRVSSHTDCCTAVFVEANKAKRSCVIVALKNNNRISWW